jgi:hypothetical protein
MPTSPLPLALQRSPSSSTAADVLIVRLILLHASRLLCCVFESPRPIRYSNSPPHIDFLPVRACVRTGFKATTATNATMSASEGALQAQCVVVVDH